MRRYKIWTLLSVLLALVLLPGYNSIGSAAPPPTTPEADFAPGELLIKFESGVSAQSATQTLNRYGATKIRTLYESPIELWQVPEGKELALATQLSTLPNVAQAEPNYIVHAFDTIPYDPFYYKQWAHLIMNSAQGWDVTTGTADVVIAILDSGIDETHPDLAGKLVAGYDFVDNDSNPHDLNGHGTHVAGIAAAITDNGTGVAGTSWGARIMPIRVLNAQGSGTGADIIDGINWAVSQGADVINLSLGGTGSSPFTQNTINNAHNQGVFITAAMGNCREKKEPYCPEANPTNYPAAYDNVMAVAATGPNDTWASYSQYGPHCDIAAPGGDIQTSWSEGIYSTMPTYNAYLITHYGYYKNYDYLNGTSQATPHVAGLAALVLSADPTLTPDQVQAIIEANAADLEPAGWDADYGHGRIDVGATLQAFNIPGAPTLNPIANGDEDGNYVVQWTADPEATTYTLEEDDNLDFTSPQTVYSGSNTQHSVANQPAGTWYYRVKASNGNGSSVWSNIESTYVRPAAPTLSNIQNPSSEDAYTVDWSDVTGATSYMLQEATSADFSPTATITRYVGSDTQYDVTGQRGGTWYYRVRALASAGSSLWSNVVSTTVTSSPLNAPLLFAIDNADEDDTYLITWSPVPSATSYTLEESADRYFASPTLIYSGTMTRTTVTGKTAGNWHYRVRAHSLTDNSAWSNIESAHVVANIYLPLAMRNYTPPGVFINGGFEDGVRGWVEYASNGATLITDGLPQDFFPHSGQWATSLGGDNGETFYIEQTVTVSGQRPYLSYWRWIASSDLCNSDYGYVIVDGATVESYTLCTDTVTDGWVQHITDISEYAGQRVTVRLQAVTDPIIPSTLLIDDVAFSSTGLTAQ